MEKLTKIILFIAFIGLFVSIFGLVKIWVQNSNEQLSEVYNEIFILKSKNLSLIHVYNTKDKDVTLLHEIPDRSLRDGFKIYRYDYDRIIRNNLKYIGIPDI